MASETVLARAVDLRRLWSDLALQHVALGGGACSCGIGGVVVRLQDFERDILDYLHGEASRLREDEVVAVLARNAPDSAEGGLGGVLATLADPGSAVSAPAAEWLLGRLTRTLTSFARLHGGVRSAPTGAMP